MSDNVVKRVSTIFTIKDDDVNKSLGNINKQMKLTQSEIKLAGERLKAFGDNTTDLKLKQEALTQQISNVKDKMSLYGKSIEDTTNRLNKNKTELVDLGKKKDELNQKYKEAVKAYGAESEEAKKLKVELDKSKEAYKEKENVIKSNVNTLNNHTTNVKKSEAELVKLQKELKGTNEVLEKQSNKLLTAGEDLKKYGSKISDAGDKLIKTGKSLTLGVTVPIAAIGTMAAKSSIEFQSAFAGVRKTVNGTEEQFNQLEEGIRGMSKTLPTSASDIAHVAEAAGQLGIQTNNILGFTKTIIDLGNATNLVGEEGASQLAKFANITQMSQKDFDRLGSTIVALGNNMATTEADIVAMGMRLAGAGTQVGLTEAQIMGLSAALSSVGIEAEAGGSAISKVFVDMKLATEKGGDSLKNFAKVSGMSASQFKKAFKEDAAGALTEFIKGLSESEKKGTSAIKVLDDMGITEVRMRDALLRAAGAGDLFNKSIQLGTDAWKENTALVNEANQRYATTESQLAITKNQITDAAIQIGNNLLPAIRDIAVSVAGVTESFAKLSPETQQNIIKLALLAAAAGPVTTGIGGLTKVVGGITGVLGKFAVKSGAAKVAVGGVGAAASTAAGAGGMAGLAASLGTAAVAAAPFVAATAGVVAAGYGVHKVMSEEVVPSVDLFEDKIVSTKQTISGYGDVYTKETIKISDATKSTVGAYMELDDGVTRALFDLQLKTGKTATEVKTSLVQNFTAASFQTKGISEGMRVGFVNEIVSMAQNTNGVTAEMVVNMEAKLTEMLSKSNGLTQQQKDAIVENFRQTAEQSGVITDQNVADIVLKFQQMKDQVINTENEKYTQQIEKTKNFFLENGALTEEEQKAALEKAKIHHDEKINDINVTEQKINEIIKIAKDENRALNEQEFAQITELQGKLRDTSISILSETEEEAAVIKERIKSYNGRMTTEMAAETIQKAEETKQKTIQAAKERFDGEVREARRMLEAKEITNEQYDRMIEKAVENRDKSIESAEELKEGVIEQIKEQNEDILEDIDTTDGSILSRWGKLGKFFTDNPIVRWIKTKTSSDDSEPEANALGTNYFQGGLTYMSENGWELREMPRGSKIFNHEASERYVQRAAEAMVTGVLEKFQGGQQQINIHSPMALSPSEIAREFKKVQQQMALGF